MDLKKPATEADLLIFVKEGRLRFPPLQAGPVETKATAGPGNRATELANLLPLRWGNRTYRFSVEARRLWTPKVVAEAVETARRIAALMGGAHPLVLVPYLSEERLLALEAEGVSGIDLCGNGVVIVPDELLILRTGFPNRFRWEKGIKNVYRKNSSVVGRTFLLVPEFGSVNQALKEIANRGGSVSPGTVSKVCERMEADLVIERSLNRSPTARPAAPRPAGGAAEPPGGKPPPVSRQLRLLQPEKLLDLLAENYTPPAVSRTFRGKYVRSREELQTRLALLMSAWNAAPTRVIRTGASSVEDYAVMAREPMQSFYCSNIDKVVADLGGSLKETDRFANVTLLEAQDDFVYFDRRPGLVASPIQTYLELMQGDTRERETASQVRRVILAQLTQARQGEE